MEHPGVSVTQIKADMSIEAIQQKITDLSSRLRFAYSIQNQPLIGQLNMVMAVYQRAYQELLNEMFSTTGDVLNKIDIS
jgi:hypothetical protein